MSRWAVRRCAAARCPLPLLLLPPLPAAPAAASPALQLLAGALLPLPLLLEKWLLPCQRCCCCCPANAAVAAALVLQRLLVVVDNVEWLSVPSHTQCSCISLNPHKCGSSTPQKSNTPLYIHNPPAATLPKQPALACSSLQLLMEASMAWGSDMSATVVAALKLPMVASPVRIPVTVRKLQVSAHTRVTLRPLLEDYPYAGGVHQSLLHHLATLCRILHDM